MTAKQLLFSSPSRSSDLSKLIICSLPPLDPSAPTPNSPPPTLPSINPSGNLYTRRKPKQLLTKATRQRWKEHRLNKKSGLPRKSYPAGTKRRHTHPRERMQACDYCGSRRALSNLKMDPFEPSSSHLYCGYCLLHKKPELQGFCAICNRRVGTLNLSRHPDSDQLCCSDCLRGEGEGEGEEKAWEEWDQEAKEFVVSSDFEPDSQ